MSVKKISEGELHAYIDGELPPERHADIEAHIASSPELAERLNAYRRHEDALRARFDPVVTETVPDRLLHRRAGSIPRALRYAAVVGWLTLGGAAGWFLHGTKSAEQGSDAPSWARRAAVAHAVYSPEVRHPVEVGADQEAHLVAWLSKRLGAD